MLPDVCCHYRRRRRRRRRRRENSRSESAFLERLTLLDVVRRDEAKQRRRTHGKHGKLSFQ